MLRAFKGIRVIRGLNSFPAQSCIFRRSYQSGEEFDPYAKPLWAKNIRKHQPFVPSKADFSDVRFDEAFDAVNCEFVHDVGLGGYVEVTDEQLDRFLPEGLGGEMYEEFELTERCKENTEMQKK